MRNILYLRSSLELASASSAFLILSANAKAQAFKKTCNFHFAELTEYEGHETINRRPGNAAVKATAAGEPCVEVLRISETSSREEQCGNSPSLSSCIEAGRR